MDNSFNQDNQNQQGQNNGVPQGIPPQYNSNEQAGQNPYGQPQGYNPNPYGQPQNMNPNPYGQPQGYNPNPYGQPQGYNPNPYGQPQNFNQQSQPSGSKTMAIWSLVLGILSLTLCCVIGWLPGLIAFILGILVLAKKKPGKGMAIAGLITGIFGILFGIYMTVVAIYCVDIYSYALDKGEYGTRAFWYAMDEKYYEEFGIHYPMLDEMLENADYYEDDDTTYYDDSQEEDSEEDVDDNLLDTLDDSTEEVETETVEDVSSDKYWPMTFTCSDESVCFFYSDDNTFEWYQAVGSENLKAGTYEIYFGTQAQEILTEDLYDYGVTQEELDDLYANGDDYECLENLCVLILHNNYQVIDGEETEDEYDTHYYGFYDEAEYYSVNMDSGNPSYWFVSE